jgi:hypothetical protein
MSGRNMLVGDHFSTILMPKIYHISENISSLQCERLLSPWRFLFRQFIVIWSKKLILKIFLLLWLLHTSVSELQQKPVKLSSQLLRVLQIQQSVCFRDIVTGGES